MNVQYNTNGIEDFNNPTFWSSENETSIVDTNNSVILKEFVTMESSA